MKDRTRRHRRFAREICDLLKFSAFAALASYSAPVDAQTDAETDCYCEFRQMKPAAGTHPPTMVLMVDGSRVDLEQLQSRQNSNPPVTVPFSLERVGQTDAYYLRTEERYDPAYSYTSGGVQLAFYPNANESTGSFTEISAPDDVTAPFAQSIGVILDETYKNKCGARALYLKTQGVNDDRATGERLPILIRMTDGNIVFETTTVTFGSSDTRNYVLVDDQPWLTQRGCIGDSGLESLGFQFGASVEISAFVLDFSGNTKAV